ncbi:hypothetical protein [Okeania sp. KiyG1]|uniref:hypothetical protein n=1 Tax=Okeania sp. KiyG1 TaxID=2720165 RepID=UPI001920631B|nr:hypothetical protein [Okeania sp. KiyG1]GGA53176.1 hypothetical protein CYANOKiyG1_73210 [Okeania sp. KiyG1]
MKRDRTHLITTLIYGTEVNPGFMTVYIQPKATTTVEASKVLPSADITAEERQQPIVDFHNPVARGNVSAITGRYYGRSPNLLVSYKVKDSLT